MNFTGLFAGGAIIGLVTAAWGHIKTALWRVISVLIQRVELDTEMATFLLSYMLENYKLSKIYDQKIHTACEFLKTGDDSVHVCYDRLFDSSLLFWKNSRPIWFKPRSEGQTNANSGATTRASLPTITFLRGTLNVDEVMGAAVAAYNKKVHDSRLQQADHRRFQICRVPADEGARTGVLRSSFLPWYQTPSYRTISHAPEDLGRNHQNICNLNDLIFPPRIVDLIEEIKIWRDNREWYKRKSIPWRRGWLLYGKPGTGKTALARAFAQELDIPIYLYNLSELDNASMPEEWAKMQANVPCIALLEDFDVCFSGRENITNNFGSMLNLFGPEDKKSEFDAPSEEGKKKRRRSAGLLNFDVLLQCIDGVDRTEGIFTIITANDISKIDAAIGLPRKTHDGKVEVISTRPGRVDKVIELTDLTQSDRKVMAERILNDIPDELEKMIVFIDQTPDLLETPAQMQERCAQVALKHFWTQAKKESNGHVSKPRFSPRELAGTV